MEVLKKIRQFISYWYVRYLLATELYMVETWEQIIVLSLVEFTYVSVGLIFILFWYFNFSIVRTCVSQLRSTTTQDLEHIL